MNETPDYRLILIRLIDKVQRTGAYYRQASFKTRARAEAFEGSNPAAARAISTHAESLARCANDMKFMFDRATARLPEADIKAIWNDPGKQPEPERQAA